LQDEDENDHQDHDADDQRSPRATETGLALAPIGLLALYILTRRTFRHWRYTSLGIIAKSILPILHLDG
jgi:hypothetical protein